MLRGVSFGNNSVHITHLQFTDDTILFLKPNQVYLNNAKRILRCFELATSLRINFHKSCVVRVAKTELPDKGWAESFRCMKDCLPITYLGLPLGGRPRLRSFWHPLLFRIQSRLAPWKRKFLNKGGRLVLVNSVLSSLPIYFMPVHRLPISVAKDIEKLQRSFFWGDRVEKRKLQAVDWELVFGRQFGRSELRPQVRLTRSLSSEEVVTLRVAWWFKYHGKGSTDLITLLMLNLKDYCTDSYNTKPHMLYEWCPPPTGSYKFNMDESSKETQMLWQDKGLVLVRIPWFGIFLKFGPVMLFCSCSGFVLMALALFLADFALEEVETIDHLFMRCSWSRSLWLLCMDWWGVHCCMNNSINEWMEAWKGVCPQRNIERFWNSLFCVIVWTIWEFRNRLVFEGKEPCMVKAGDLIKFRIVWWFKNLGKGSRDSIQSLLLNFKHLCIEFKKTKKSCILDWLPPSGDNQKFNVDDSVFGKPGPTVKRAAELCLSNVNLRDRFISIVSDSKVAVSWANNGDFGNINCVNSIYDIRGIMSSLGGLEVVHDSRAFNSFADSLAKMGSNNCDDFVEWWDF
ncbi:hypothetical protein Ddye_025976 [Dipteronia dyeriana]|uniref:Reverse transcriptase domain-containing protein n=1 Tax=Dipteronia dyeriana TaxID=168575 RepID=A0AAD9TLU7_9ROSI|nr:hypothetical protein Ddye_025976 [Dipteronia dyeriana]